MLKKLNPKKIKISFIVIIFAAIGMLFSCSNQSQLHKLKTYIVSLKGNTKNNTKPTPQKVKLPPAASYQAVTLRAPFESTQMITNTKVKSHSNPLLLYPVNVLRFVGTLTKNNNSVAFVLTPDDKLYQVRVGDAIGDNEGRVTKIYPYRVEILEMVEQDSSVGKFTTQNVVIMQLKEEKK